MLLTEIAKANRKKNQGFNFFKVFLQKKHTNKEVFTSEHCNKQKIWSIGKLKLWIYENHIWELQGEEYYMTEDYCSYILSYNSSACSSHIWFSYIRNFIIILSKVYNELIQWPALSWRLLTQFVRALYQYCRGQIGFESHTSLNFFQAF